jgi:hypothetical protein
MTPLPNEQASTAQRKNTTVAWWAITVAFAMLLVGGLIFHEAVYGSGPGSIAGVLSAIGAWLVGILASAVAVQMAINGVVPGSKGIIVTVSSLGFVLNAIPTILLLLLYYGLKQMH